MSTTVLSPGVQTQKVRLTLCHNVTRPYEYRPESGLFIVVHRESVILAQDTDPRVWAVALYTIPDHPLFGSHRRMAAGDVVIVESEEDPSKVHAYVYEGGPRWSEVSDPAGVWSMLATFGPGTYKWATLAYLPGP